MRIWRNAPKIGSTVKMRKRSKFRHYRLIHPEGTVVQSSRTDAVVFDKWTQQRWNCKAEIYTFKTVKQ